MLKQLGMRMWTNEPAPTSHKIEKLVQEGNMEIFSQHGVGSDFLEYKEY